MTVGGEAFCVVTESALPSTLSEACTAKENGPTCILARALYCLEKGLL